MLPTVNLYDQPCFETDKVDDVMVDRLLSPEPATFEVLAAQNAPQRTLRIGHVSAELACVCV